MRKIVTKFPRIVLTAILLGPLACSVPVDVEEEQKTLLDTDVRFSKVSEEKGPAEAFYEFLAEDAIQLPHRSMPIHGREAIRNQMSEGPPYGLRWEPQEAVVSAAGDLGYTWGHYEATFAGSGGETVSSRGKYVNVWRKQPDGAWKVIVDIGNQSVSE